MPIVGGRTGTKTIKNPFETLSMQYLPSDIKKAFEISEDIYKTNITIFRALYKLAEYPITQLKYSAARPDNVAEGNDEDLKLLGSDLEQRYREIFEDHIDINRVLIEMNLNYYLYSNDIPMLHLPFQRMAVCKECMKRAESKIGDGQNRAKLLKEAKEALTVRLDELSELKWSNGEFKAKCQACGDKEREFSAWDDMDRSNFSDISVGRLNIHRVTIQRLEFSGKSRYLYDPSDTTKKKIRSNDQFTLANEPMIALKAVNKKEHIEYNPADIFHFRMPSPIFKNDSPWSWPLLVSAFQTIFFISIMRRGAEAIAYEHINPKPWISPAKEIDSLLTQYDMGDIKANLLEAYKEAQEDDGQVTAVPFPIASGIMNQHGRSFLPQAEISQATTELLSGIGLAEGLLSGQGPFNANSIAIRIIENGFLSQRDMIQRFIKYLQKKIQYHYNLGECEVSMTEFRKLDDSLHKQMVSAEVDKKRISAKSHLKTLGYEWQEERPIIEEETRRETTFQAEMEALLEEKRAEMQAKSENIMAAKMTERNINELQNQSDAVIGMITDMVNKGYTKEFAMDYVSQFMAQQSSMMEIQAANARAAEAQQAFMLDRRASATHSLNRAENKMQVHQDMDMAMQDPAMQMASEENDTLSQIVQRCKLMKAPDLNRYLDETYRRNAVLHRQIVERLQQEGVQYEGA